MHRHDDDHHHHHEHPGAGLLLLIPAAVIAVGMAKRRRMQWHEYRPSGVGADPTARDSFRLPPRIEWMLETWHTRAHETPEEPTSSAAV